MTTIKPGLPKGMRDFGPEQSAKRGYIIDKIKEVYKKYGFSELSTPAMENLSTLTGKYGEEGDQLLFKVLNSGDFMNKVPEDINDSKSMLGYVSEKGLKYDLTVPFARYVVSHQHEITYPFKRFQIQPVWRADRPQKGRYREFYQCDADIIGSKAIWNEAELTLLIHDVFQGLGLKDFVLKINHRDILNQLARAFGMEGKEMAFCVELDKLDKIGSEKVKDNLSSLGADPSKVKGFLSSLEASDSSEVKLHELESLFGIHNEDLQRFFKTLNGLQQPGLKIELDLSLARGLSYYTGMIFEVKPTSVKMGSICGGGRYDDLTGVFGLPNVSGVGISFGLDRIYDVMEELDLFPTELTENLDIFIVHLDTDCYEHGQQLLMQLREVGIAADIYHEEAKMKKQFNYADKNKVKNVLVVGDDEMKSLKYSVKNMKSGDQTNLTVEEIIGRFAN